MKIVVKDFVNEFVDKKITNTKYDPEAVENFIREKLEIKTYLPFREKQTIAETVVKNNIEEVDYIKRYDSINAYISFVVSTLVAHTNLEFSNDPVADYDLLAESGLLSVIIQEYRQSYDECDVLRKMALDAELADNNLSVVVGKFLNGALDKLGGAVKGFTENLDLSKLTGTNIKEEDIAKVLGFVDKFNK